MARIPDAELEQLKRDTDLVALVQAAGVELRRHGANLVGRCPFHDDQGPSLVITPAKNLWHCLGACQAGGSVIDWVMRTERVSFRHAVEWLRARAGSAPVHALAPIAAMAQEAASLEDTALVRDVLDFYHETLTTSPEAIAYLETRGLNAIGPDAFAQAQTPPLACSAFGLHIPGYRRTKCRRAPPSVPVSSPC